MVSNAVLARQTKPDSRQEGKSKAFYELLAPLNVNGKEYAVKIVVRESLKAVESDPSHKFYDVSSIEMKDGDTRADGFGENDTAPRSNVPPKYSLGQLATVFNIDLSDNIGMSRSTLPKTITVNGKERPATNSEGQPIYPTIDGIKNYWRWFYGNEQAGADGVSRTETSQNLSRGGRDTKATQREQFGLDSGGQPRRFYHGTHSDFQEFRLDRGGKKDFGWLGQGHYVTNDQRMAESYANIKQGAAEPNIMPLYISAKNPYFATLEEKTKIKRGVKRQQSSLPMTYLKMVMTVLC